MEEVMRKFVIASALLTLAAPAYAENICIDTREIVSNISKDGKTMVFKMRDGRVLVNHLHGSCPDLRFQGLAWNLHSGDTRVCENEQSFQVLQSMQTCTLGKFDAPDRQAMSKPVQYDANREQVRN
jgi:hypothetical protein